MAKVDLVLYIVHNYLLTENCKWFFSFCKPRVTKHSYMFFSLQLKAQCVPSIGKCNSSLQQTLAWAASSDAAKKKSCQNFQSWQE